MGDMTDFHLDEVVEAEHQRHLFHSGQMSEQEAYERGFVGESGDVTKYAGDYSSYSSVSTPESLDRQLADAEAMLSGLGDMCLGSGYDFSTIRLTDGPHILSDEEEEKLFTDTLKEKYSDKYTTKVMKDLYDANIMGTKKLTKEQFEYNIRNLKENYPAGYEGLSYILFTLTGATLTGKSGVNDKAVVYAQTRENPTCNICESEMKARTGRYGKFYFCANQCEGQSTVSDKYWQEFKLKVR